MHNKSVCIVHKLSFKMPVIVSLYNIDDFVGLFLLVLKLFSQILPYQGHCCSERSGVLK